MLLFVHPLQIQILKIESEPKWLESVGGEMGFIVMEAGLIWSSAEGNAGI